jgi:hypothetical protein
VPPEILLNDGTGRFRISPGALPTDITDPSALHYDASCLVDVNGDRSPDLVLAGSPQTPSRVLLNDGTGHFSDFPNALPPKPWGLDAEGLAITPVDLNDDGRLDLLVGYTKNHPFYKGRWIQVLINSGNGTFRDETKSRLPQTDNSDVWPYSIQVADLNGDGKPDLAVSLYWYRRRRRRSTSTGATAPSPRCPAKHSPHNLRRCLPSSTPTMTVGSTSSVHRGGPEANRSSIT